MELTASSMEKENAGSSSNVVVIPDDAEQQQQKQLEQDPISGKTISWRKFIENMNKPSKSPEDKRARSPDNTKAGPVFTKKIVPVEVIDLEEYEEKSETPKISQQQQQQQPHIPKKVFCYNCGRSGHSGHECKLPLFEEICMGFPPSFMGRKSDWWRKYAMDTVLYGPRIPLVDKRSISNFTLMPDSSTPSPGLRRRLSPNRFYEDQGSNKPVRFCGDVDDSDSDDDSECKSTQNGGSAAKKDLDDIDDEGLVIDFIPIKKSKKNLK